MEYQCLDNANQHDDNYKSIEGPLYRNSCSVDLLHGKLKLNLVYNRHV
ncbi:Uncharacterised protein [Streptococcus pneumoniae]|nr:Uncharacterised protein [Streptococcus pneumoniae]